MTSKGKLLSYTILVLFLFSLFLRSNSVLIISLPLITLLLFGALTWPKDIQIKAHRNLSRSFVEAGEQISVEVLVENQGSSTLQVSLLDPVSPIVQDSGSSAPGLLSIPPYQSRSFRYSFAAKRGILHWKSIELKILDPLSIFESRIEFPDDSALITAPKARLVSERLFQHIKTFPSTGIFLSGKTGQGSDYHSIEKYFPGAPLKHLNWRLSNRSPNQWLVNLFEREEIGSFSFLINAGMHTSAEEHERAVFEECLETAAGLSASLIKTGNKVSLIAFGENLSIVHPGTGPAHTRKISRRLAELQQGNRIKLMDFTYFPITLFPSRSKILVFNGISGKDLPVYQSLMARGYEVVLFTPDSLQKRLTEFSSIENCREAYRLARIERQMVLNNYMDKGIPVIFLDSIQLNAANNRNRYRAPQNRMAWK